MTIPFAFNHDASLRESRLIRAQATLRPIHNRHVLYTRYLEKIIAGRIGCFTEEEGEHALLLSIWRKEYPPRMWLVKQYPMRIAARILASPSDKSKSAAKRGKSKAAAKAPARLSLYLRRR